jgi:cellulose 1,4-beta-cellobiosidase
LANLITNLNVPKCANAEAAYKQCTIYALEQFNIPNVSMYMDAGHAGWLGWSANIGPAASLFSQIYAAANKPASV